MDEAAEEWCKTNNKGIALSADKKSHYLAEGKEAFIAGAEWQKAKMLEGAIEGRVNQTGFHNSIYIKEPKLCDTLDKFNNGDKVRVIIIKDDK